MQDDHFHDECAIFGIHGSQEASNLTFFGLFAQQHRGQESTGIVSSDGRKMHSHITTGKVAEAYTPEVIEKLKGSIAIGHNRYSTTGESHIKNAQPFLFEYYKGSIALAHNGNLINAPELKLKLEENGSIFRSTNDTEVIMHLIALSKFRTTEERVTDALGKVKGSYSLLVMTLDKLIVVRDPYGIRPLSMGRLKDGSYCFSSETCAFSLIDAEYVRDVEPGEMVVVDENGLRSHQIFEKKRPSFCIFEMIYFARPDSMFFGQSVHSIRKEFGRILWEDEPAVADLVMAVPDSGISVAMGYAAAAKLPFEMGLTRNHYVGRTFIEPKQSIRDFRVKIKLNPVRDVIEGKRVVVVDDSIVRGTTSKKIVRMIREAGAKEVHLRISSPPTAHPCYYGIDTPEESQLIASRMSVDEICRYVEADSLGYIATNRIEEAVKACTPSYCKACFDGKYPIKAELAKANPLDLY